MTWLIRQGIKFIFYPCIPYERNETPDAQNHYNCPIVTSYADNIKNNVEEIAEEGVRFMNPFMAFTNEDILENRLVEVFTEECDIPEGKEKSGPRAGKAGRNCWLPGTISAKKGEETLKYLDETGRRGIVLAGRPYHVRS